MQDNVSVIIATIVAVVIIVLFPIYNIATRQDSIANNMVVKATTNFVDEVRNKGYIDKETYGEFLNELDKTGNTYDVEMEVYKPILLETGNQTDEYEQKYEITYTAGIIADMENSDLYKDKESVKKSDVYYLYDEYKFYVRVKNTNITQAQVLLDRLLSGSQKERIVVNYGGIVYSNEWAKGRDAEAMEPNISISRPLKNDEKTEFKYEFITKSYDEITGEVSNIYGIACRLSDDVPGANIIKFRLEYRNVEYFLKDEHGNRIKDEAIIENHIANSVNIEGFEANINVERKSGEDGKGNYTFMITLSNINYDFGNIIYLRGKVSIKEGSAYTKYGPLSKVNSKEFVIFYKPIPLEIELASTPDVFNNNVIAPSDANITFTVRSINESENVKLDKVYFEITNNNEVVKKEFVEVDQISRTASISHSFISKVGTIKAYGIDSRGIKTETKGTGFVIIDNYLKQSINRDGVTEMLTVPIEGARISSFRFYVYLPTHYGDDWWRVTGRIGNTDEWINIYPYSHNQRIYVLAPRSSIFDFNPDESDDNVGGKYMDSSRSGDIVFESSGGRFVTYWIDLLDLSNSFNNITQLKFQYRTDPSHKTSSCLNGGNISYKVQYKFED